MSAATTLLGKARRRLWMKYAMRGVSAADAHGRLDLAYAVDDPWNMQSERERARFEATNRIALEAFGPVHSLLEIGCGEGHQTEYLQRIARDVFALDVSTRAIERARQRVAGAQFHVGDVFDQPWGARRHRFDLVTACDVLYYMADPRAAIDRMRHLAPRGLVTFYAPTCANVVPHLTHVPGLRRDWISHGSTAWLVAWWRDE